MVSDLRPRLRTFWPADTRNMSSAIVIMSDYESLNDTHILVFQINVRRRQAAMLWDVKMA